MKVYILIPYYSNGIDVNLNEVKIFESYSDAETHVHAFGFNYYDIVEK
jgi:hypothetical protein